MEAARYEAVERLRDGRQYKIRALEPGDQGPLLTAVVQSSAQALYRRFFLPKRSFTVDEIAYFVDVDFIRHVALVAALEDAGQNVIIGGCRYIVAEAGKAEVAFMVVDRYQGQGVGTTLLHHLAEIARAAGLKELTAEVLMDNIAMLRTFEKSGLRLSTMRGAGVAHVTLGLC